MKKQEQVDPAIIVKAVQLSKDARQSRYILQCEQSVLTEALMEIRSKEGEKLSYREALEDLVWDVNRHPEKFLEMLPQLRAVGEKHVVFEVELPD